MRQSALRPISQGIVANDPDIGSMEIEVNAHELFPTQVEDVSSGTTPMKSTGIDADGNAFSITIDSSSSINAMWMGAGNLITPPNVRRGNPVTLWQEGDSDNYFWSCNMPYSVGTNARRLETATWAFSGISTNAKTAITADTHYMVSVSTHDKRIVVSTSKKNGEVCRYKVSCDPGEGSFTIADDKNGHITRDTVQDTWTIMTGGGTGIKIENGKVTIINGSLVADSGVSSAGAMNAGSMTGGSMTGPSDHLSVGAPSLTSAGDAGSGVSAF